MAKKPKGEIVDPTEKLARVIAIGVTKGMDKEEAARRLLSVGFDAPAIGGILGVNANFANVAKGRKPKKDKG
ncbi:hypothetical protein [Bradyrhizobium sp. G127]|uniref:hypothetical protein n=1 Tax=Bradyrhizobium sp. G127 TaxID=2904800 RepID=UPI001F1AFF6E|nr:hypothetical protein [Bradyrhizobium sp. G127]MCF2524490.1 hypothetical protein [Bradyrhizobium sp. G127]